MNDRPAETSLVGRIEDLEVTVKWLTNELGALSERLTQATQVEVILKRARQGT